MPLELTNLILTGASGAVNTIQDNPLLLSADLVGRLQIVDRISVNPEVGDFQIIAGQGMVWNGERWVNREVHGSYDPISFVMPPGTEVWTVYPGWRAMKDQMVYCHYCFANKVSRDGGMPGWWVTPNHMDSITCMVCGTVVAQMPNRGQYAAFVRKASR